MQTYYRHTKIIATLGPATDSPDDVRRLITSGVDVIRLNMAYAAASWVRKQIDLVRAVSLDVERQVAVMMDLNGPEVRTGEVESELDLSTGDLFDLCSGVPLPGRNGVTVSYPNLSAEVEVGNPVLLDNGQIRLEVIEKVADRLICRVLTPGRLGSGQSVKVPGVTLGLPSLTEKDYADLVVGVEAGVDFVALSFARRAEDVEHLRQTLRNLGSRARIIAKIEDQSGLRNLDSIVDVADAVMVARGDLGVEIEYHILPLVQSRIVEACLRRAKPVIIATQLLESMMTSPTPTRAEISDVSNAIKEMVDAVMLSGETATGRYPHECVTVLKNISESTEPSEKTRLNELMRLTEPKTKMLRSAALLAQDLAPSGIVVFTRSGSLPYLLGALRAQAVPVYAFTDDEALFRQLLLPWGIEPFLMRFSEDPEATIRNALDYLKRRDWCDMGSWLVVITNALAHGEIIDTIQLRRVV